MTSRSECSSELPPKSATRSEADLSPKGHRMASSAPMGGGWPHTASGYPPAGQGWWEPVRRVGIPTSTPPAASRDESSRTRTMGAPRHRGNARDCHVAVHDAGPLNSPRTRIRRDREPVVSALARLEPVLRVRHPICIASYNLTEPPPLNPGQPLANTTASCRLAASMTV